MLSFDSEAVKHFSFFHFFFLKIMLDLDSMAEEVEALKNNMVKKTELQESLDRLGCLLTMKQCFLFVNHAELDSFGIHVDFH